MLGPVFEAKFIWWWATTGLIRASLSEGKLPRVGLSRGKLPRSPASPRHDPQSWIVGNLCHMRERNWNQVSIFHYNVGLATVGCTLILPSPSPLQMHLCWRRRPVMSLFRQDQNVQQRHLFMFLSEAPPTCCDPHTRCEHGWSGGWVGQGYSTKFSDLCPYIVLN